MKNNEVISHVRERLSKNIVVEKIAPDIAFSLHHLTDEDLENLIERVQIQNYVVKDQEFCLYNNPSKINKEVDINSDLSFIEKSINGEVFCYTLKPKVVKAIELLLFNPNELLKSLNGSKNV